MTRFSQILIALAAVTITAYAKPNKVVCYYGSWAVYRPADGKFAVENIDPFKCTHAIYSFVGISSDGTIRILDAWNEIDLGALSRFNKLKEQNPSLKTLIAIGGWNEGSLTFSQVAANPTLRQRFAENALAFLQTHGFDGFDLDWEYPAQRGGSYNDKENVNLMIEALRKTFDATGRKYLITAAVAASGSAADISYDIPNFAKNLDFINLMAYDFHGAFDGRTGQNAPLYSSSSEHNRELNVDAAVKAWLARGAPAEKIVLGMGTYGRSFTVSNPSSHGLNNPADPGAQGPFTREQGMLGYNEICTMLKQGGWTEAWDDEQKVPSMYAGNQWVGYDDERSIRMKAEYAISMNLGGAMIWSIETDDFSGRCGRKFPLLSTINEVLFGSSNSGSNNNNNNNNDDNNSGTTVGPAATDAPIGLSDCTVRGYIRDAADCSIFYYCEMGETKAKFKCPAGLYFSIRLMACEFPQYVPDCQ